MIIQTADINPSTPLSASVKHQVYCGLDNCVTLEVRRELEPLLASCPEAQRIYRWERALQAPYLEMMCRGFAVNESARRIEADNLRRRITHLDSILQQIAHVIWDRPLNPRSHSQLQDFFYRHMRFPEIWISQKGERKLSTNREVLEKLYDRYLYARPIVSCILSIRDLHKQLERLTDDIDPDGRFRTSYNIAGTETGRPSSSENAFGTGGNAQNIAPSLRHVFVADVGWKICSIDLEQVEARDVGFFEGCLFGDWTFLDACESGDLHTTNAKRIWHDLGWTDDPRHDREVADQTFYREFSYRDMAKRGSHLSNYMGTAFTAARALKVPQQLMEDFQARYCRGPGCAYPAHSRYWQWCAQQLQTTNVLTNPFGRRRHFFGRPNDDTTIREAIAFLPQSTTSDRTNLGLWRIWKYLPNVRLLAQTYDSATFEFPEAANEAEVVEAALELMSDIPLFDPTSGRKYVVPGEAKIGWNWGNQTSSNPLGLVKWSRSRPDTRKLAT